MFKIAIGLIISVIFCVFLTFLLLIKKNENSIEIRNYQYVCVLPQYAERFEYPYIQKNFDRGIKIKINNYLNSINKRRNSEREISLIFTKDDYSSFAIIDNVYPSEFKKILGLTYNNSYNGTCFKFI